MAKKRIDDDDNDDESNNEHSLLSQAKKRRKLINSSQYQKGIDSQKLLTKKKIMVKKTDDDKPQKQQQQPDTKDKLFKTNFSSSNSNGPIETVMQQKHQSAMEDFIAKRMNHNDPTATNTAEDNDDGVTHSNTATTTQDADQGAGGTMLGGTGIAEVILPVEQRLETVKKTHELLQKKHQKYPPSRRKATTERTTIPQTTLEEETPAPSVAVDDSRLGFQAMRHGAVNRNKNSEGQRHGHNHASDSRVFKQFLKREGVKNRR